MKVSDFVIQFLVRNQITDIFTVSGGGIAHLLDAVGRNPAMRYYCNYHEQACAVAAEGYARVTGKVGALLVTVGPGAINALSGIVGAWYDSLPVLVLSGQVRTDLIADFTKVRQKGPQEANVIEMARPVTKYAVSVREPNAIRRELEKALHLATSGRKGPVWVEIPFDIQGAEIDESTLEGFLPEPVAAEPEEPPLSVSAGRVLDALRAAQRPLIIGGNGVRLAGCRDMFLRLVERFQIPVVVHLMAKDLLPEDHPMNIGLFGTCGQRRANFAVQNADLVIFLGASMTVTKLGFNYRNFAPKATKVVVNIDRGQVEHQALVADVPVVADLRLFLQVFEEQSGASTYAPSPRWLDACSIWKKRYPIILDEYFQDRSSVNFYVFWDQLSERLGKDATVITGNGSDVVSCFQAFRVKEGQRVVYTGNWGAMGWDLPLAIGASLGRGGSSPGVLVTGDGSFQWNIQELLTVQYHRLPLKIFLFNNRGYASIRATQKSLFEARMVGADEGSGVGLLDFRKLADLYGFAHVLIKTNEGLEEGLSEVFATEGCVICELNISPDQAITPKASAFRREDGSLESRPLEDMAPFLPREEVRENMHLFDDPPWREPA